MAHSKGKSLNDTIVTALTLYLREAELEWGPAEMSPDTRRDIITDAFRKDAVMVVEMVAKLESERQRRASQ